MYELSDAPSRSAIRQLLAALVRNSIIWPLAIPAGFALLFGLLATLAGIPPLAFALDFLAESAIAVSGLTVQLWVAIFFSVAFCFGVGHSLPQLLLHRPLNPGVIVRFTQAVGPWATAWNGLPPHCANASRWQPLTHHSRTAASTVSDLAGASPRLE